MMGNKFLNSRTFILLALMTANVFAQSFSASVSSPTVGLNGQLEVSFTFKGASNLNGLRNFKAPDMSKFGVLSGPNQSQSMQIINNTVSASLTLSYYLLAKEIGTQTIGPASVELGGKTYKTQPLKITVVKGVAQAQKKGQSGQADAVTSQNIGENLFIRAVADKQNVQKGEQVTVTYKLYTRLNIAAPQVAKLPQYQGFWSEEIDMPKIINMTQETLNGKRYNVAVLKKAALFPSQSGQLSVTPLELNIPVQVPKPRRRSNDPFEEFFNDPFFNQAQRVDYKAKSNTIKINVAPQPGNAPKSFNGAVGKFQFDASIDKKTVKVNEPVTLRFTISGTGNIKLADMPELTLPAGFEKYDPKITDDVSRVGVISGKKVIEYLVVPRAEGKREIPPIEFSYYNPAQRKYVTLSSPAFELNVERGSYSQGGAIGKEDVKILNEDIRFIKVNNSGVSKDFGYVVFSFLFWLLVLLPVIGLFVFIRWAKKNEALNADIRMLRYRKAEKMARKRLKTAEKSLAENKSEKFYSDISLAIFGYLEDKLHMPKSEFTIDGATQLLQQMQLPEELSAEVKERLVKCEFARFAPDGSLNTAMNEMYKDTVDTIVKLEREIK
jgi:hypothetical protein